MIKKYSPIQITVYWIVAVLVISAIIGLIANGNSSGGEQKLFVYDVYSVATALIGIVVINISILFFYPALRRINRLYSLIYIILSLTLLYPFIKGVIGSQYDVVEKTRYAGSYKIEIKTEHYTNIDTSNYQK
jgi:cytochrome b561